MDKPKSKLTTFIICAPNALNFSLCLTHGYLPKSLMETTIVQIVKNKCGNLSNSNNYRPIAIGTITSKVLE